MTHERNALKAGLFIVISFVLILGIIFSIRGFGELLDPRRNLTVTFDLADDIGGLRTGDEVRIGGYQVGTVREINLVDQADRPQLEVVISVPKKFDIRRDADIRIQSSITGVSMMNFQTLGKGQAVEEGETIKGGSSTMAQLMKAVNDLSPRLATIAGNVEEATAQITDTAARGSELLVLARRQIDPDSPETIAHAARSMMSEIGGVVGDSKGDLRKTAANVAEMSDTPKAKLPQMAEHVDALVVDLQKTVEMARGSMEDLKQTVANARDVSGAARSIIVGNRSKIEGMVNAMKTTGDNLKNASSEIRRSPWRLLYKPGKGEVTNLNLFDSARAFAEGASQLADASQALRDAINAGDGDAERLNELMKQVQSSFEQFEAVENKLWEEVRP